MRSHRVWSKVHADAYMGDKSFGGEFRQHIKVGSSAAYSDHLASVEVREIPMHAENWTSFALFVDGIEVKRKYFNNKTREFRDTKPEEK